MNLRKRTLALLLTLCMLLSVVVPMASAAETTIQIGKNYGYTNDNIIATEFKATKSAYLFYNDHLRINFKTDDSEEGGWAAVRIPGSAALNGTYTFAMSSPKAYSTSKDDWSEVYFLNWPTETVTDWSAHINGNMNASTKCGEFNSSSTDKQDMGTVSMDGNDFILVFKCSPGQTKNIYATVGNLYFTPVATQSNVASNGSTEYATVAAAIAAAQANAEDKTVKLIADATADVEVPEGITLDLNGNTLTVTEITCDGVLKDSSNGDGLLKTTGLKDGIQVADGDLLLYDSRDGMDGYRVYKNFEIAPHYNPAAGAPEMQTINSNVKRLWIKLSFDNDNAYEVIATGHSGLTVGAKLAWTGLTNDVPLTFDNDKVIDWAGKMAANDGKEYGFYIDFTGFDSLADGTLTLTPFVGNVSSGTSVSYVHAG